MLLQIFSLVGSQSVGLHFDVMEIDVPKIQDGLLSQEMLFNSKQLYEINVVHVCKERVLLLLYYR